VFLTLLLTGLRRSELQRLRWSDIDLLEGTLRVRESKSEEGERSIALSPGLQTELGEQYRRTAYKGQDELVFCHPDRGTIYRAESFKEALDTALKVAGIDGKLRAFHDLRHSSLTLGAASGEGAIALMARAGHRNMATTRTYLHLAGTVFRDEAARLEERLLGEVESSTELRSPERI
jgi:integrase